MPELPEVESVRLGLLAVMNKKISHIKWNYPALWDKNSLSPELLINDTLTNTYRKGKYLTLIGKKYQLLIHLGMSGVMTLNGEKRPHTHLEIHLIDGNKLFYSDPRKFGHLDLQASNTPFSRIEKLGPDAITDEFNNEYLAQVLKTSKSPIKSFLLNQAKVAGLGNIYVCEVLFSAKVHPGRLANKVNSQECNDIVKHSKRILLASIENRGTTFSDYRLTNGKGGDFQDFLQVFQKENQPCPICSQPIEKITQSARSSFYCPTCQK